MPWNAINCSNATGDNFEPNVSSVGVLIGFLVTASATFLSLLFYCVAAAGEPSSNVLDISLRQLMRTTLHWTPKGQWDKSLRTVVVAMSDQQLATGIAIFVSGYSQLQLNLSLYHWQMITTLTWFSTTTHLATLPFLEHYFRLHKYILYLRVFLMFGLAMCFIDSPYFGFDINNGGVYTILSEIMLFGRLLARLIQIFPTSKNAFTRTLMLVQGAWRNLIILFAREENNWGFGQLLPVLLLFLPVLLILETWSAQTQSQISLHIFSPVDQPTMLGSSPSLAENDSIYTRIASLCINDFWGQSWYLETLYFTMSFLLAITPMLLRRSSSSTIIHDGRVLIWCSCVLLCVTFFCLTTIPICGIIDGLELPGLGNDVPC
ncbi:hypothetical protein BDW59DRAFT_181922 [Aspergillus cavernicola]|uniref:Transmembrane protein n=1 Tax=Aspergillus cavernicola TaxID=176166 RepID=A0ABR4HRW8_9EURO